MHEMHAINYLHQRMLVRTPGYDFRLEPLPQERAGNDNRKVRPAAAGLPRVSDDTTHTKAMAVRNNLPEFVPYKWRGWTRDAEAARLQADREWLASERAKQA